MGTNGAVTGRDPSRWVRDPRVLWRWTAGGALILPPGSEDPITLNGAAAAIWELLARPTSLRDALRDLSQVFSISEDQIRRPVQDAITQMNELGAIAEFEDDDELRT